MTVGLNLTNVILPWLKVLNNTAATAIAANWVELHTADPGANGTTGVSVGSTTRLQVTWTTPTTNTMSMSASIGPWTNGGTSETLTDIAVFSASTAGNFLFSAALTTSQAWASGNTFTLTSLTLQVTPQAA